jgi:hypothetical protein
MRHPQLLGPASNRRNLARVIAVIGAAAISFAAASSALAKPAGGLANKSDFKVEVATADINQGTSTIMASGRLDSGLFADGYRIRVQPTFSATQDCVSTTDPTVHQTVASGFNRFATEVHIGAVTFTRQGSHYDWSAEVSFTNPTDGGGFYNWCPSGFLPANFGITAPQFTVTGAAIELYPSRGLVTSPPVTNQGDLLLFSTTFPVGLTT